jgi:hypothetical protein
MAKRGRRGLGYHLLVLAVIYLLGYALLTPRYGLAVVVLLGFVILVLWMLFVMPTRCDFEVQGRGCRRRVNGKFFGCHDHGQAKRDAVFAAFNMRNPGMAFRVMWLDRAGRGRAMGGGATADGGTGSPDSGGSAANRGQALFTGQLIAASGTFPVINSRKRRCRADVPYD